MSFKLKKSSKLFFLVQLTLLKSINPISLSSVSIFIDNCFYFNFVNVGLEGWQKIIIGALLTTVIWILTTYFTPPDDEETLRNFVKKVTPGGPGWTKYSNGVSAEPWPDPKGILSMILGCISVYSFLLGVGQLLYGEIGSGMLICGLGLFASIGLFKTWK